jgi:CheY-like chemotaxis protein
MMAEMLTDAGYVPHLCADVTNALSCIQDQSPDAVLLDLRLRQSSAWMQLLEQFRNDPVTSRIPIIVTSANAQMLGAEQPRLQQLAAAVVPKPFDLDEMMATVREVIV